VFLHTSFAAGGWVSTQLDLFCLIFGLVIVTLSLKTSVSLDIPSVMLTVLGVVIGFVIAYRVGSGYASFFSHPSMPEP